MNFENGDKITVYDSTKTELGEGTLIKTEKISGLNMMVYECREHTILAKGTHFVLRAGSLYKIELEELSP